MGDIRKFQDDMSLEEQESLQKYKKNGCPGLIKTTEADIFKWFEMYMSGKTYTEIARFSSTKKDLILYMSNKMNWCEKKMEHYSDLALSLSEKSAAMKLETANTLHSIVMRLGRYYNNKMSKSMTDSTIIDNLDTKLMQQFNKSIEMFNKIMDNSESNSSTDPKTPLVNINMAGGTISQIDDETIEISDKTAGDLLKALAGAKKSKLKEEKD